MLGEILPERGSDDGLVRWALALGATTWPARGLLADLASDVRAKSVCPESQSAVLDWSCTAAAVAADGGMEWGRTFGGKGAAIDVFLSLEWDAVFGRLRTRLGAVPATSPGRSCASSDST